MTTVIRVVGVTVVAMEMGRLRYLLAPPGPWSGRALGLGWGSGL